MWKRSPLVVLTLLAITLFWPPTFPEGNKSSPYFGIIFVLKETCFCCVLKNRHFSHDSDPGHQWRLSLGSKAMPLDPRECGPICEGVTCASVWARYKRWGWANEGYMAEWKKDGEVRGVCLADMKRPSQCLSRHLMYLSAMMMCDVCVYTSGQKSVCESDAIRETWFITLWGKGGLTALSADCFQTSIRGQRRKTALCVDVHVCLSLKTFSCIMRVYNNGLAFQHSVPVWHNAVYVCALILLVFCFLFVLSEPVTAVCPTHFTFCKHRSCCNSCSEWMNIVHQDQRLTLIKGLLHLCTSAYISLYSVVDCIITSWHFCTEFSVISGPVFVTAAQLLLQRLFLELCSYHICIPWLGHDKNSEADGKDIL